MIWLRIAFLLLIAKPLARLFTGVDVIDKARLPQRGPAIIAANHSSHVDTLLLLTMFPAASMHCVRPVAAADYFLKGPVIGWFSRRLIGIVPIERDRAGQPGEDVLAPARAALRDGAIVIVFPEGTRRQEEGMGRLKHGVARLAQAFPEAPVIPVWVQGASRVLPKGESVPVPLNCTVHVGLPIVWSGHRTVFMEALREALESLAAQAPPLRWS